MGTYTPNLNLYKPDANDDFGNFRAEFNDNMDKLDNGGGGGGGHTIVDENGSDMPAESKLQFTGNVSVTDDNVNGATVIDVLGGGGNVYGFAIDESRKLFEGTITNFTQTLEYTATEDAIALVDYSGSIGTNQWFLINGVIIPFQVLSSGRESFTVPIRKGDKISARHTSDNEGCFFHLACYGIKQGTNGIYAPVIYSDNERVIGVWRNNKPLYQKTFLINLTLGSPNTWYSTGINISANNFDEVVKIVQATSDVSAVWSGIGLNIDRSSDVELISFRPSGGINIKYLTIQYTKTTDVAGSGNWNTDGVPTVHYSTSEQVVGTWIDGKPLYEKTVQITAFPNATTANYPHGILNADTLCDYEAKVRWASGGIAKCGGGRITLTGGNIDTNSFIGVEVDKTNIVITTKIDRRALSGEVTIRYTKTTD